MDTGGLEALAGSVGTSPDTGGLEALAAMPLS
jgi:hypothetical protein